MAGGCERKGCEGKGCCREPRSGCRNTWWGPGSAGLGSQLSKKNP